MTRELALKIVNQLTSENGHTLTLLEAMAMTKILSDGYEVYSIQKGDVTFSAWVKRDGSVTVKTISW